MAACCMQPQSRLGTTGSTYVGSVLASVSPLHSEKQEHVGVGTVPSISPAGALPLYSQNCDCVMDVNWSVTCSLRLEPVARRRLMSAKVAVEEAVGGHDALRPDAPVSLREKGFAGIGPCF